MGISQRALFHSRVNSDIWPTSFEAAAVDAPLAHASRMMAAGRPEGRFVQDPKVSARRVPISWGRPTPEPTDGHICGFLIDAERNREPYQGAVRGSNGITGSEIFEFAYLIIGIAVSFAASFPSSERESVQRVEKRVGADDREPGH
jgi:hypothetical protein